MLRILVLMAGVLFAGALAGCLAGDDVVPGDGDLLQEQIDACIAVADIACAATACDVGENPEPGSPAARCEYAACRAMQNETDPGIDCRRARCAAARPGEALITIQVAPPETSLGGSRMFQIGEDAICATGVAAWSGIALGDGGSGLEPLALWVRITQGTEKVGACGWGFFHSGLGGSCGIGGDMLPGEYEVSWQIPGYTTLAIRLDGRSDA